MQWSDFLSENKRLILILLVLLVPALPWMWSYLHPSLGMGLAIMAWPFAWHLEPAAKGQTRFAWWAVGMLGLYFLLGNNLWLWLGVGCAAFFAVEQYAGKTSWLQLLMLGLLSPVVGAWMMAFSFPLRIWLSERVGQTLVRAGLEVVVQGNRFLVGGQWFEVEAACLGVSTLTLALICVPVLLGLGEKKRGKAFPLWEIGLWTLLAVILGIAANFGRTLWLVLFAFPPETIGHELIGLIAIGTTVLLPLSLLVRFRLLLPQSSEKASRELSKKRSHQQLRRWLPLMLACTIGLTALWAGLKPEPMAPLYLRELSLAGTEKFMVQKEVARFKSEQMLVYVKAPTAPWRADHNPQVCWRGSGYRFSHVERVEAESYSYMQARLIRQTDTLYTVWWYDNGQTQTGSTYEWRRRAMAGDDPFYLWNVTVERPEQLAEKMRDLLD